MHFLPSAQASPFDEQVPPSRVPYRVFIPVWSSLDGRMQAIEVSMEVIPDSISNLSRVDTAVAPLSPTTRGSVTDSDSDSDSDLAAPGSDSDGGNSTAAAFESSPGTSVSGLDVAFYVHALDRYGNALDTVEMNPACDIFRTDTAGQERQAFQVLPLTTVAPSLGGFPGLLQGAHCVRILSQLCASSS